MADDLIPPLPEDGVLAGEYALGLLDGADRAAARRRLLSDPGFAADVAAWEHRFAPLGNDFASQDAPEGLWERIDARLGSVNVTSDDEGNVVMLRQQVARWRGGALATGMAAAVALAVLIARPGPPPIVAGPPAPAAPAQYASAVLSGDDDAALIAARYDPASGILAVRAEPLGDRAKPGTTPELWVIPAGGAPISLGQVEAGSQSRVPVDAATRRYLMADGSILAVTIEERSATRHAAPGSTPIATGKIFVI